MTEVTDDEGDMGDEVMSDGWWALRSKNSQRSLREHVAANPRPLDVLTLFFLLTDSGGGGGVTASKIVVL